MDACTCILDLAIIIILDGQIILNLSMCSSPVFSAMKKWAVQGSGARGSLKLRQVYWSTGSANSGKLVLALKPDPVTISNELAAAGLIPLLDGEIEAQRLARYIVDVVKVEPSRYVDILSILSKHDWLNDLVNILQATDSEMHHNALKTIPTY